MFLSKFSSSLVVSRRAVIRRVAGAGLVLVSAASSARPPWDYPPLPIPKDPPLPPPAIPDLNPNLCPSVYTEKFLADPANNLTGVWTINRNGMPGRLDIVQDHQRFGSLGHFEGDLDGDRVVGYFAFMERTAVLIRYSSSGPATQAIAGKVSPDGSGWNGTAQGLDVGASGASQVQNAWSFAAARGTKAPTAVPALPPSYGPAEVASSFTIFDRPKEYGTSLPGSLAITVGSVANPNLGEINGTVFGEPFIGTYAMGSIAFLRERNGKAGQLYIGHDAGSELVCGRLAGAYYALSDHMGASPCRMTYDWRADA